MHVVLFAVGSPLVVDVEESCWRVGWTVTAAIRNIPGPVYTSSELTPIDADAAGELTGPLLIPLFSPATRRAAWRDAVSRGALQFPNLVDPTSIIPRALKVDEGVYVNAGCVIGAASWLGRFSLVNRGASLGHHLTLGAFASIGPGVTIAGGVTIGDDVMIGAGAIVLPGRRIGDGAVISAGVVVRRDVAAGERLMQ